MGRPARPTNPRLRAAIGLAALLLLPAGCVPVVGLVVLRLWPGQVIAIDAPIPAPDSFETASERDAAARALQYMDLTPGKPMAGTPIDVAFIGSCTNGRLSDFREVANFLGGRKVASGVKAIAVPGSQIVGRSSGRECIARLAAGSVAKKLLLHAGVTVSSTVTELAGIPIESEVVGGGSFAGQSRYRIDRRAYELADLDLAPEAGIPQL